MTDLTAVHTTWWEAYAADRALRAGEAVGPLDDAWLAVAARLHAQVVGIDDQEAPATAHDAIDDAAVRALHRAIDTLATTPSTATAAAVADAARRVADDLDRAGAFHLAGVLLRDAQALCAAHGANASDGSLLWQRARAARQAGQLDAAADGYAAAAEAARRVCDSDTELRALLGTGNLAHMRGNYPAARAGYREALRRAAAAGTVGDIHACAAHQGLALAAVAARDLDAALAHGWAAYVASGDADDEAHALLNVAEACRLAGDWSAALRAALAVVERASVARLRMPALGTAADAAARLGRDALLRALRGRVDALGAAAGPYEHAHTLLEFAEAWALRRVRPQADDDAHAALAIGERHGFHEIVVRADTVIAALADDRADAPSRVAPAATARWSRAARAALHGVHALPDTTLAHA
ncbi:MAG: hypothetical protein MUF40_02735 [Gemmatimonadaceae bacterium]|nr:hypothetical protein [Gemmatimonadaceae bacterium]